MQQLQKTVVEGIRNWAIEAVVKQAVLKVVARFVGLGAIANAIEGIYNAISFLIVQASQIQALVNAVRDSIGNIAAGQIGTAASVIESTLARSLSLTINFLAQFLGLGNVGQRVREIIERVRVWVDAAVNKLVDLVVNQGNSWLATAGGGQSRVPANRLTGQPPNQGPPPATRQTSDGGLPPTQVTYGTNDEKAAWVLAEPLTKLAGNTEGSKPHQNIAGWRSYILRMPPQQKNLWDKVHLLSQKLHGPGEFWNLVPARKTHNAARREKPEKAVKNLVEGNAILYYHVSVAYHTGTKEESKFPSKITITYGHLERKANGGYKRKPGETVPLELAKPPSIETAHVYDINGIGEIVMHDLGIDQRVARNIIKERNSNGDFRSASDFLTRMNAVYNNQRDRNPKQRTNFEADHWSQIQELIKINLLRIGSPDQNR